MADGTTLSADIKVTSDVEPAAGPDDSAVAPKFEPIPDVEEAAPAAGGKLEGPPTAALKELMKLRKKLREIEQIENLVAAGGTKIDPLQKAKVEKKADVISKITLAENIMKEAELHPEVEAQGGALAAVQERVCNLWLIRHGEKAVRPPVDWQWSLSDHGHQQAQETAAYFASALSDLRTKSELWASPFLRTVQTAAPIARQLGITARLDPGLGEARQGENLKPIIPANSRVALLVESDASLEPSNYDDTHEALVTPCVPEYADQYTARVLEMARHLKGMSVGRHLIVVTHASIVTGLTVALTGQPLEEIGVDGGNLHEASVTHLQGGLNERWQVVQNGSTAHLSRQGWDAYRASRSSTWQAFVKQHGNGPFV